MAIIKCKMCGGDSNATKQLCRKAAAILAERNQLCKLNKG